MSQLSIPMSGFVPGKPDQTPMQFAGQKLASISVMKMLLAKKLSVHCLKQVFWPIFRMLPGLAIHSRPPSIFRSAQLRALETGRMMLRATNTGMTAIIDTDGSVLKTLEPFTRDVLRGEVRAYQGGTPYVRWGNWPVILWSVLVLLTIGIGCRRHNRN